MARDCGELLEEVRVALRPPGETVDVVAPLAGREEPAEQVDRRGQIDPAELEPLHPFVPRQLGEERRYRMASLEVVGPDGCDQEQSGRPHASDDVVEEIARRAVAPMEILDDDDDRFAAGLDFEAVHGGLEEPRSARVADESRAAVLARCKQADRAERRQQGAVWRAVLADHRAGAGKDSGLEPGGELGHEACLADTRLSQNGHEGRVAVIAGALECVPKNRKLGLATDKPRTSRSPDHPPYCVGWVDPETIEARVRRRGHARSVFEPPRSPVYTSAELNGRSVTWVTPTFLFVGPIPRTSSRRSIVSRDFVGALLQLNAEKQVSREQLIHAVEDGIQSAYRRVAGDEDIHVRIDAETGKIRVFRARYAVAEVEDPLIEFTLEEARDHKPDAKIGELVETEELDGDVFGRIGAQTAKQIVLQRIREVERDQVFDKFASREGEMITGAVNRVEPRAIILDVGNNVEAILATSEQSAVEHYRIGQNVKAYVLEVRRSTRGPQILVSRTHKGFLKRLFELEVPEIHSGHGRDPGDRPRGRLPLEGRRRVAPGGPRPRRRDRRPARRPRPGRRRRARRREDRRHPVERRRRRVRRERAEPGPGDLASTSTRSTGSRT